MPIIFYSNESDRAAQQRLIGLFLMDKRDSKLDEFLSQSFGITRPCV